MLRLEDFEVNSSYKGNYTINQIVEIQKNVGYNFAPDFLYLSIFVGCIQIPNGIECSINDIVFGRTLTFVDYELDSENFELLPDYQGKYMSFAYTKSNQWFFLMGTDPTNLNQIFLIDNNFGDPPVKVSDNIFSFFNQDLKKRYL